MPGVPLNATAMGCPTQWFSSAGLATDGTGFTVTVKVVGGPLQPLSLGVTVSVDICGVVTLAEASDKGPLPEAGIPVAVLLFVQLNVAVGIEPVNSAAMGSPAQSTWAGTALTVG